MFLLLSCFLGLLPSLVLVVLVLDVISTMSASVRKQNEPWRNQERHYCRFCNVWMGGDRQSILIHENGRKHKENVERELQQKRDEKRAQSEAALDLQQSLEAVQRAAIEAHSRDATLFGQAAVQQPVPGEGVGAIETDANADATAAAAAAAVAVPRTGAASKADWNKTKRKREAENRKKDKKRKEDDDDSDGDNNGQPARRDRNNRGSGAKKRRKLRPDEGHYTFKDSTYLEGPSFGALVEVDMAVEVWIGSRHATADERKLPGKHHFWNDAIVVRVRNGVEDKCPSSVDVSYLLPNNTNNDDNDDNDGSDDGEDGNNNNNGKEDEEVIEKMVPLDRVRILLGGDEKLPSTLDEARLCVDGEKVVKVEEVPVEMDENTGLSSWGTIEIRTTTVNNEVRQEREEARRKRKEEALRLKEEQNRLEDRRLEEAKVEAKEDSALGAYQLQGGYRGVDVSNEAKLSMQDTVGSLSGGQASVGFKKIKGGMNKKNKKKKKNMHRRSTSADD